MKELALVALGALIAVVGLVLLFVLLWKLASFPPRNTKPTEIPENHREIVKRYNAQEAARAQRERARRVS